MITLEDVHKVLTHGLVKHDLWQDVEVRTIYTAMESYIQFRENGRLHKLNLTENGVRPEIGEDVQDEILMADPDLVENVFKAFNLI